MSGKAWGNEYRSTTVCVDSYDGRILSGRFYNPFQPEGTRFTGVMDFIKQISDLLDKMDFPQSFSAVRSFAGAPRQTVAAPPENKILRGGLATFEVKILFRQNTSWQGSLTWLDKGREEVFRSVLELLCLLDSALGAEG